MKRKVINRKYLPTHLPIILTAVVLMGFDFYSVPGWAWGVGLTILAIFWIVAIFNLFTESYFDEEQTKQINSNSFKSKLREKEKTES